MNVYSKGSTQQCRLKYNPDATSSLRVGVNDHLFQIYFTLRVPGGKTDIVLETNDVATLRDIISKAATSLKLNKPKPEIKTLADFSKDELIEEISKRIGE